MHKVLGKENILVYNCFMAMGRRNQRQRQKGLWVAAADLPQTAAHPFYRRLNELLDEHGFDDFAEQRCEQFYAAHICLLIGYLEGIDSERGIAWRLADSISLRRFLAIELDESTPDHSTISRTRRLIDVETHREVFSVALPSKTFHYFFVFLWDRLLGRLRTRKHHLGRRFAVTSRSHLGTPMAQLLDLERDCQVSQATLAPQTLPP